MRKAITPVIATVLLLLITISIALLAWVWLSGYLDSISGCIKIVDVKDNVMFLQNCGQVNIPTFDSYIADVNVPVFEIDRTLPKDTTKKFTLTYLPAAGLQTLRIVSPYAITAQGFVFPKAWVIKAAFGQLCITGNCYFQVLGDVYLNDGSGRKYTNKPVNVNIDNGIIDQDVLTNATGGFSVNTTWNFTALFPGAWWPVSWTYNKLAEDLIVEPPGNITYSDNIGSPPASVNTPQALYRLEYQDNFIAWKDITPLRIDPNFVTFQVNYTITTNPTYVTRMNTDGTPETVWYTAPFTSSDINITCFDTPTTHCHSSGDAVLNLSGDLGGKVFDDSNTNGETGDFTINGIAHSPFANETPVVLRIQINNATVEEFSGIANITSARPLFTITTNDYNIIQDGKTLSWHIRFNLSRLQEERRLRYNDNGINGTYIAAISILSADGQIPYGYGLSAFSVNFTAQIAGIWDLSQPSKQITWEIPNFVYNQSYQLAADVTIPRTALPTTFGIGPERISFVNTSYMVNESYSVHSGGIPVGTSPSDVSFAMTVPSVTQDLMYYTLGIPLGFGSNISLQTKTYLANTGQPGGRSFTAVTVYTSRGEKAICEQTLTAGSSVSCNIAINPTPQEAVKNNVLIVMGGSYSPQFSFGVNSIPISTCKFPQDPLNPNPLCDPYARCRGTFCPFTRCGGDNYCDETTRVSSSATPNTLNANVDLISLQNAGDSVLTTITLWNWYLNPIPLWNNKGTHNSVFVTKDPKPFFPATVFYTFIS